MLGQRRSPLAALALAGAFVLATGCASVHVMKVTDGDRVEGIPFYLPRPYVQVFEPFVIGAKPYVVSGRVSDDGKFLLIDNVADQSKLGGLFLSDVSKEVVTAVPLSQVLPAGSTPALTGAPQGATEPAATPSAPATVASAASAPASVASAASTPVEAQPVGNLNISVTNTSAVFPPSLGRRFFDVVWMPDFDEKYIVQASPGLGNSNIGVTMTQGWGLYGLDAKIDNSALVKPLLDFYSTGLDALGKLAKSKIFPAGALATGGGSPQGLAPGQPLAAGTRVSIKITRVQVVAPGMYPILKPTERAGANVDPASSEDLVKRHIPLRPYTNIAFNTYEVVVIEAAKPSGDTPMNLQRYFDATGTDSAVNTPAPPSLTADNAGPFNVDDFLKKVNDVLASRKGSGGETWTLSNLKVTGTKMTGTAKLKGGTNKPDGLTNMAQLAKFVSEQSNAKFLPGDIALTEAK